jgi:hypothetical protein
MKTLFLFLIFLLLAYYPGDYIVDVWDDLQTSPYNGKLVPSKEPGLVEFPNGSSTFAYGFDPSADKCIFFSIQMPHGYKEGTNIIPHVHWAPMDGSDTGTVVWQLDYSWSNTSEIFPGSVQIYKKATANTNAHYQQMTSFDAINGSGKTISSIITMTLCRDADGTNDTDSFAHDAALLSFDVHYRLDTLGSRQELSK